jgi:hypothetical protein
MWSPYPQGGQAGRQDHEPHRGQQRDDDRVISTPVMMTAIATPGRGAAWAFSDGAVTLGTDTRLSLTCGCYRING